LAFRSFYLRFLSSACFLRASLEALPSDAISRRSSALALCAIGVTSLPPIPSRPFNQLSKVAQGQKVRQEEPQKVPNDIRAMEIE